MTNRAQHRQRAIEASVDGVAMSSGMTLTVYLARAVEQVRAHGEIISDLLLYPR